MFCNNISSRKARVAHLEEKNTNEAPYRKWADRGLLTICRGNRVNYSDVTAWFCQMRDEYKIDCIKSRLRPASRGLLGRRNEIERFRHGGRRPGPLYMESAHAGNGRRSRGETGQLQRKPLCSYGA